MEKHTGNLISEKSYAELLEDDKRNFVLLEGSEENVRMVSDAVKRDRRAKNKAARKARRKARG
jgi:hypothetical protein